MSYGTPEAGNTGLGFAGVLFLVFLVLKLCGVIGWSWWWITSPLWIGAILLAVALMIVVLWPDEW